MFSDDMQWYHELKKVAHTIRNENVSFLLIYRLPMSLLIWNNSYHFPIVPLVSKYILQVTLFDYRSSTKALKRR